MSNETDTEYAYVVYPEMTSFPTRHEAVGYAAIRERQLEIYEFEVNAMAVAEVEAVASALEEAEKEVDVWN